MKKTKSRETIKSFDWISCLICLLPVVLFFVFNAYCFDIYYDLNDDVTIKDILSGAFTGTPNAHVVYMKFPLTLILSFMYCVFPSVSWFGLFELLCLAVACFVINYSVCKLVIKRWLQVFISLAGSFIFQSLLIYQNVFIQYTVVSGVLAVAGMVILFFSIEKNNAKIKTGSLLISILLFVLSFCIRDNMFLFVLPFIVLSLVVEIFLKFQKKGDEQNNIIDKRVIKRILVSIIGLIASLLLVIGIDTIAYSSDVWREYKEFNDYRTTLFDYQKDAPWYMFHPEIYDELGFSEAEAQVLVDTNLAFSDKIDSEVLKRVVEFNKKELGKGYFSVGFKEALTYYLYTLHKTRECKYCYLIIALYLFLIIASVIRKRYIYIPIALLVFLVKSMDWMYLIMRGRIKDRVTVPLCFCEIMLLLCLIIRLGYEEKRALVLAGIVCILLAMFYPMFKTNLRDTNDELALRAEKDRGWVEFTEYCEARYDNFFFLDLISDISFSEKVFNGEKPKYTNYVLCGGWLSKTPIYGEKLKVRGIDSVDEAIVLRDDVYFISMDFRDTEWIKGYYQDRGYNIICEEVDRIYINDSKYYAVYSVTK